MTTGEQTSDPFEIAMPRSALHHLDEDAVNTYGSDFRTLAVEDPHNALEVIRGYIEEELLDEAGEVKDRISGNVIASAEQDGELATVGAAHEYFERSFPEPMINPIDVIISVLEKPGFKEILKAVRANRAVSSRVVEVIQFRVDPPSYTS